MNFCCSIIQAPDLLLPPFPSHKHALACAPRAAPLATLLSLSSRLPAPLSSSVQFKVIDFGVATFDRDLAQAAGGYESEVRRGGQEAPQPALRFALQGLPAALAGRAPRKLSPAALLLLAVVLLAPARRHCGQQSTPPHAAHSAVAHRR